MTHICGRKSCPRYTINFVIFVLFIMVQDLKTKKSSRDKLVLDQSGFRSLNLSRSRVEEQPKQLSGRKLIL